MIRIANSIYLIFVANLVFSSNADDLSNKMTIANKVEDIVNLLDVLEPTPFNITLGGDDKLCRYNFAFPDGENIESCEVVTSQIIQYHGKGSNGDQQIQICSCSDAVISPQKMATYFGAVPYPVRSRVKVIFSESASRFLPFNLASSDIIAIYHDKSTAAAFVHESAHTFDNNKLSASLEWHQAIADDSCVISDYASNEYRECFAETAVFWVYLVATGQDEKLGGERYACMQHQLSFMADIFPAVRLLKYMNLKQGHADKQSKTSSGKRQRSDPIPKMKRSSLQLASIFSF